MDLSGKQHTAPEHGHDMPEAARGVLDSRLERALHQLELLHQRALDGERDWASEIGKLPADRREDARNLAHYLSVRQVDLRGLQRQLAELGLSSLGRSESAVLDSIERVLALVGALLGRQHAGIETRPPAQHDTSPLHLATTRLFGAAPSTRQVRIMVTLPSEAAGDAALVASLVEAGMDVARVNCAHDDAQAWRAMASHVRHAAAEAGREVRILMDLGGPKLRTGALDSAKAVMKMKPRRDDRGQVLEPFRLGLVGVDAIERTKAIALQSRVDAVLGVDARWLSRQRVGDRLKLRDARDAKRELHVVSHIGKGTGDAMLVVEGEKTCYLEPTTEVRAKSGGHSRLTGIPLVPGRIELQTGQRVCLIPEEDGAAALRPGLTTIPCSLREIFPQLKRGERVFFDDGRIGGRIVEVDERSAVVELLQVPGGHARLAADKGINLPDSRLELPALTPQDLSDLDSVARLADMVGLSFAQSAQDVRQLLDALAQRQASELGIVLKIETTRGFRALPGMMFAAMSARSGGIMIARGDLAVEMGYERLAEVQEELLWACEAAHLPVIWATQVLESEAKGGTPTRAEVTDAAMGVRAECVMLNKGDFITSAIRSLDDILRRMADHQEKKRSMMRALESWQLPAGGHSADERR